MDLVAVGPYEIIERLGQGAMGEVFLAHDTRLHRKVAIKRLSGAGPDSPEERKHALQEARAVAGLNHPNIAGVYDIVVSDGHTHIIMEYVRGSNLAATLSRGPMDPLSVAGLGRQIADGLAEAHRAGIIHRDLKPANIVVDGSRAKILDFGVARRLPWDLPRSDSSLTPATPGTEDTHPGAGTPAYMAPERRRGESASIASDIYSLGVVLFECLTGVRPFDPGPSDLGRSDRENPGTPLAELAPLSPGTLNQIILRALDRDPSKRYRDARTLAHDLSTVEASLTDASTLAGYGRLPRVGRAAWWGGIVAACVAVGGIGAWLRQATQIAPTRAPVVAVLPFSAPGGDPRASSLGAGLSADLIAALSTIRGLSVAGQSETAIFPDVAADQLISVARTLGVTILVQGTVQTTDSGLRAVVTLLRAGETTADWTESYLVNLSLGPSLAGRIAADIAAHLRVAVSPVERQALRRAATANVEAWAEYTQARSFLERPDVVGNAQRSIDLFQRAIERDPTFALAHAGLGDAYWMQYQTTRDQNWTVKARDAIAEALRLDGSQPLVRLSLASLYDGIGKSPQAMDELRRLVAEFPDVDQAHRLLGQLLVESGDKTAGVLELEKAIALRPSLWRNFYTLGYAHSITGAFGKAANAYERATILQPDNAQAVQALGTAYDQVGDLARALRYYRHALELAPDAAAHSDIGRILYEQGEFDAAARSFERAVTLEPKEPIYHRNLGDALRRRGQPEAARAEYRRALSLCEAQLLVNEKDGRAIAQCAVDEAKLGLLPSALRRIELAQRLAPESSEVWFRRAIVLTLAGRNADAVDSAMGAIARGYSAGLIQRDDDLRPIRNHIPQTAEPAGQLIER